MLKVEKTLDQIAIGHKAIVKKLYSEGSIRRRLLDIGLVPETKVTSVFRSQAGDPTAYFIRGTLIALRKEDAKKIVVEELSL